jgi:uncharacterized membrane protein (UPF0127 family)
MRLLPALAALMLALPVACHAADRPAVSVHGLTLAPLSIATATGQEHRFTVEVAATEAQQQRGLMFRTELAPDAGMIFPMKPPRFASFWMKNTIIPLDIIFIRADGTIARIAAQTTPFSLFPVDSGEPVAAVLELAGGRAAALGVREGDRVRWKP